MRIGFNEDLFLCRPVLLWTCSNENLSPRSVVKNDYGDVTEKSILLIRDFQSEDLNRELNCSVRNQRGFMTRRVHLEEKGEEYSDQNQQLSTVAL